MATHIAGTGYQINMVTLDQLKVRPAQRVEHRKIANSTKFSLC